MTSYFGQKRKKHWSHSTAFNEWLAQQRGREDLVGEIARFAEGDSKWPESMLLHSYVAHLYSHGASKEWIEALRSAWWGEFKRGGGNRATTQGKTLNQNPGPSRRSSMKELDRDGS